MKGFLQKLGIVEADTAPTTPTAPAVTAEPADADKTIIVGAGPYSGLSDGRLTEVLRKASEAAVDTNRIISAEQEEQFQKLKGQFLSGLEAVAHGSEGLQALWRFIEAFKKLEAVTDLPSRYKAALSVSGLLPTEILNAAKAYPDIVSFVAAAKSTEIGDQAKPAIDQIAAKISDLNKRKQEAESALAAIEHELDEAKDFREQYEETLDQTLVACQKAGEQLINEFKDTGDQIQKYLVPALDTLGGTPTAS